MLFNPLNPPLRPRNGFVLCVLVVARISTDHQDPKSLADQEALCRSYIMQHFDGDVEVKVIASQGSGEHLDRQELRQLEDEIASQKFDVLIVEDLGRICRRQRAIDFCEMCQNCATRLIAINDRVDTLEDGWQDRAMIAVWHHERSNRDTADRIRRSLNHRFDQGGVVQFVVFGYLKPPGAKSDQDLQKDPAAEPLIREMFQRLERGALYAELADWLNDQGISPGPCCRLPRWDGAMVGRLVHNPIFKGVRLRNRMVSKRHNKTGRHRSVKAEPHQLRTRKCPHLAYFEAAYYDRVVAIMDERNGRCRRTNNGQPDPRLGVSRKRTRFPGQHARCGICGRLMHWHGMKSQQVLLCAGAADYRCWNGQFLNGGECGRRILDAIRQTLEQLPDFDAVFGDLVREQVTELESRQHADRRAAEQKLRELEQKSHRLVLAIEAAADCQPLLGRLRQNDREQSELRYELQQMSEQPAPSAALPAAQQLRALAAESLQSLAVDDPEGQRLLRQLVPDLLIMPYQICDGSDIIPCAEFTLTLVPFLPPALAQMPEAAAVSRRMVVPLCALSQRVQLHADVAALKALNLKEREIGARLGMAQSAVQRSFRLHRIMLEQGLTEPYIRLTELPEQSNLLRRHQHPRFRFEPLPGWEVPPV